MYFNKNDISLYYEKYGNGKKDILILPGWGDTRKTFNLMINNLKDKNTIYIFDYPGFGRSIFPDYDLNIYDYSNIIRSFIEKEDINNPIIIAHSFGGRIASLIAGYYKDSVNKLILIDAASIKPRKKINIFFKTIIYKFLKKLQLLLPKQKRSLYLKKLINIFGSTDYKSLNSNMYNTFKNIVNEDLTYSIKNINVPTLLIWGKNDKDTPLKDGIKFHKYINNSKLEIIDNAAHFPYLNYPSKINNLINDFIEKE